MGMNPEEIAADCVERFRSLGQQDDNVLRAIIRDAILADRWWREAAYLSSSTDYERIVRT